MTAISTESFVDSLGINTHLDFAAYGYENVGTVENAIRYLGVTNLRDSAQSPGDATLWQQVAQATGAKFDDYIGETSPAGMSTDLSYVTQLANEGILNYLEGGNEEDDSYPASLGNTLGITAQFQQQVYSLGQRLNLPVINMSFGSGWTAANNWQGDYGAVGDVSGITNFANAHDYPTVGQTPGYTISRLNGLANLAAASRPVMTTEIGWDENAGFSQTDVARYVLDTALDGIQYGDVKTYFYALFNDGSGNFGLMNSDGTPKPAGTALHNLTTLLADNGANAASFTPRSLNYSLSINDNTVLMQKSDGTYWLAVWNENTGAHTATLTLGAQASQIELFDPTTGTSSVQNASDTGSFTFTVPDHPVIVEIIGSGSSGSGGGSSPPITNSGGGGTASNPPATTPPASPSSGNSSTPNPVVSAPASETAAAGASIALPNVSISDPWAAGNAGTLALNVTATGGTVAMTDANGNPLPGSGTAAIHISDTLAQLNADLATLSYTAGASGASVTVDIWDQAGIEASQQIAVGVGSSGVGGSPNPASTDTSGASASSTSPTSDTGTNTIAISPDDSNPVELVNNATIVATGGDHMIFIGGTGDTMTATGGTETVQAFQGGNAITTGDGNDTISYAGSNNVIDAGGGSNLLQDSGANNTIVLPAGGAGADDIFGYVLMNGDQLDLRAMLTATSWQGDAGSLGNFIQLTSDGASTTIQVDPSGTSGGATYSVATLEGAGAVSLTSLLAHAIT